MLQIGWGSRDVSTNEPALIMGQAYERISTGSMDPTTVTALILEDGGDSAIFISGDFTSFTSDFLLELKEEVKEKIPGVDPEKILLNATHTHTAPRYHKTSGYDLAPTDRVNIFPWQTYRRILLDGILDSIRDALQSKKEGFIAYGVSSAEISVQRRCVYAEDHSAGNTAANTFAVNGHGIMYGKTDLPDFLGFEGSWNCDVNLLYTFDGEKKLTGAIVNVPCPSQCTEHEAFTSADFWNEAREEIRKEHGNIFLLPQCAAGGDLSPHRLIAKDALTRRNALKFAGDTKAEKFSRPQEYYNRKVLGERIAHAFSECLSWAKNELLSEAPICHKTKVLSLEAFKITEEEYKKAKANLEEVLKLPFQVTEDPLADFTANTKLSSNIGRYRKVIDRYEAGLDFIPTQIHALSLGPIAFASNPFELYTDYQNQMLGKSPFVQTFFLQLCASSVGDSSYLATEKAVQNKGYSAIPFSCSVAPKGGETLVKETLALLNEVKA